MKKKKKLVEPIDFNRLRANLKTIMVEVDRRLESEYDAFSPNMWNKLRNTVDAVVIQIRAVRLALNGHTTAEVASKLGLRKQHVAAMLAYNTMWQADYASPEDINGAVDCPVCHVGTGNRCVTTSGQDARTHETRREAYRQQRSQRALNTKQIRKVQKSVAHAA